MSVYPDLPIYRTCEGMDTNHIITCYLDYNKAVFV